MLLRLPKSLGSSLAAGCAVLIVIASTELALWYFGIRGETSEAERLYVYIMQSAMAPMFLLAAVIGAPIAEELMFRGYLQSCFERTRAGFWGAAVLLSSVWGLYHPYAWQQRLFIAGIGLLLALLRKKTGSVIPGMAVHGMINLITSLIYVKIH